MRPTVFRLSLRTSPAVLAGVLASTLAAAVPRPLAAQAAPQSERAVERRRAITMTVGPDGWVTRTDTRDDADRAWLGIATAASSARDTLGVLIRSVVPGSPAEQAGLEEGMRLTSINGTSLRLSPADAGDPEMQGVLSRRLTRALRDVKPGADVSLGLWADGKARTVTVKTIAAADQPDEGLRVLQRAALGVSLGWQPSRRDSLGIFVAGVTDDGPADKAGLVEGDRLVAINGQDLRVPREDAGDAAAAQARVSRLNRVLRGIKAGDDVELRVLGGGKVRTVKVKTVRAADLGEGRNWSFGPMIEGFVMPPTPPMPPRVPGVRFFDDDGGRVRVTVPRSRITI